MIDLILVSPMTKDFLIFIVAICTLWIVALIAISFWDREM